MSKPMLLCAVAVVCMILKFSSGDTHTTEIPNAGNSDLLTRYSNFVVLSSNKYELYWKYTEASSRLDIAVRVRTTGWVGLGVSERGNMVNSDLAVGWVADNGEAILQDRYAGANGFPGLDTRNDLNLIRGSEDHGWTTLEFWRLLETEDSGTTGGVNHDRIISEGSTSVIFAYGETDVFTYHESRRGSVAVYFLGGNDFEEVDAKTVDFLVPNLTIPSKDTTYWCAGFRLPEEIRSTVRHMIRFAPVVHEPATPHVHHMLLYTCDGIDLGPVTDELLRGGECLTQAPGVPAHPLLACTRGNLVAAWAVGGDVFSFPDDVSFSFGGEKVSQFWMLEMHYDNPTMASGVFDVSGIRITYTDTPRMHDAGMMAIGALTVPYMMIPPHQSNYNMYGICESSCTSKMFPAEGITAFANILHTHLQGHRIALNHFRNGEEMSPPIDQDLNYDFNFQQTRYISSRKILPGDKLQVACGYQTLDRNSTVFSGLGTYQEMCFSFLFYYPRTPLTTCISGLKLEQLLPALRIDQIPSINMSAPISDTVNQLLYVELPNPDFPWTEHSRSQNLVSLFEASATDDSISVHRCLANEAIVNTDLSSGSRGILSLSTMLTIVMVTATKALLLQ